MLPSIHAACRLAVLSVHSLTSHTTLGNRTAEHLFCVPMGSCLATTLPLARPTPPPQSATGGVGGRVLPGLKWGGDPGAHCFAPALHTMLPRATVSKPRLSRVHSLTCSENYSVTYGFTHCTLCCDLSMLPPWERLYHLEDSIPHPALGPRHSFVLILLTHTTHWTLEVPTSGSTHSLFLE